MTNYSSCFPHSGVLAARFASFHGRAFPFPRASSRNVSGGCVLPRAFPGSAMEYNKLVDEELTTIESALDEVADDVDNLDYSIAVSCGLWVLEE